jgi:RNA polymerase sigma-70 factor (ECF subfamily)
MIDQDDFKALFDACFEDVRRYVFYLSGNEEVSTDIAQDCFLKVWEKRIQIDPLRARGLLFKIARDLYLIKYKRDKLAFNFFRSFVPAENISSTDQELGYKELQQSYENALKTMPEKCRIVFLMSRADELKYREIAERTGISIKAVEKRMNKALEHLRRNLRVSEVSEVKGSETKLY